MRRQLGLISVAFITGCSAFAGDPYPMPSGPPHAGINAPAEVGERVEGVVLFLTPRPGDEIELLAAEPVWETDGADVRFYLSRPMIQPNGDLLIGDQLEPLAGAIISNETTSEGPENTVGIVAEMVASEPGRYQLTAIRLRYRLNGAERVGEGIDAIFTLCADDPKPEDCSEEPPA